MELLQPEDRVWVQDFHLIPLGTELRRLGFTGRLGFFLHIPFPPTQLYATMPWHRELAADLCAYDAVGFQTPTDREHFADYRCRELGAVPARGRMAAGRRADDRGPCLPDRDRRQGGAAADRSRPRRGASSTPCAGTLNGRALIVGVDRLDYSKGIPERLRGFQALLERYPSTGARSS